MGEKKKQPATVWFSLKKSLQCKSEPSDVQSPKARNQLNSILTRNTKTGGRRSGCSRSIANLKDVIHGSKRHLERPPSCSPRSIGSSEFLNPIAHEVILSNSRCELKITGFGGFHDGDKGSSTFVDVGTLRPGTPGPGGVAQGQPPPTVHYFNPSFRSSTTTPPRKTMDSIFTGREKEKEKENGGSATAIIGGGGNATVPLPLPCHKRASSSSFEKGCNGNGVTCPKCGEQFLKWEALQSHHLSRHAGNNMSSCFFPFSWILTGHFN